MPEGQTPKMEMWCSVEQLEQFYIHIYYVFGTMTGKAIQFEPLLSLDKIYNESCWAASETGQEKTH